MEPSCIRQTALPHASRLFTDFSYHFDRVAPFYRHNPHDPDSFARAAAEIIYPDERRAALVQALRRQNGDSPSLDLLARRGTVAVVTGQQVGLFSGPCYTIYKALTAAKLAAQLTAQGIPAAPVFWLATEDHDFAEVDHAWVFDGEHQPVSLRATSPHTNGSQRPVGGLALDDIPVSELRESLRAFPFGEEVAAEVASSYRNGVTMGGAFRDLLSRLLGRFNLLFLDPLAEDIRRIGAPMMARASQIAPELKRRVDERNRELAAAGYHAQVHIEPQTSLFFLLEGGRRIGLKVQNGDYVALREGRYSTEELASRAEQLSPNALLRPVLQDYLLPTVAYAGGPAELAYLAQAQVLYDELLGRMPVPLHRAGFTLVDSRADKLLSRYELGWPVVFEGADGIRDAVAKRLVPPAVHEGLESSRTRVNETLAGLDRTLAGFDSTLASALGKSRAKIEYQLTKIGRKVEREAIRRDARASEEARFLAGLLYPNKHLQERLYTILPFLAKHGFELIDRVYEEVQFACPDHRVLVI